MDAWLSWSYHYGLGGLLFIASISLAIGCGALHPRRVDDRRLLVVLVAGLLIWMGVHALWIFRVSAAPAAHDAQRTSSAERLVELQRMPLAGDRPGSVAEPL